MNVSRFWMEQEQGGGTRKMSSPLLVLVAVDETVFAPVVVAELAVLLRGFTVRLCATCVSERQQRDRAG